MWNKAVLAGAVVLMAAAPEMLHVVKAAPEPAALPPAPAARAATDTRFKPVCRGDEILDSRPDPAWVSKAFKDDRCQAPRLPAQIDGTSATREQVVAVMAEAKAYAAASDAFQRCVSDFVAAKRVQAAHGGEGLTPSQVIIENHRVLVSQRSKERAAGQVRLAINQFNQYGSDCAE